MDAKRVGILTSFALIALLAAACVLCGFMSSIAAPGLIEEAYADVNTTAAKVPPKNLEKLGVKFDLKRNKAVKTNVSHQYFDLEKSERVGLTTGMTKQPFTVKITKMHVAKAKKKGYKQASFVVTWTSKWKPTKRQISNIISYFAEADYPSSWTLGTLNSCVVDYATGENLEVSNSHGVKAKIKKKVKYTKYKGRNGEKLRLISGITYKYNITYPSNYKNLAFGVGGGVVTRDSNNKLYFADENFWNHSNLKYAYTTTSFFKKGKKNFHFMRIK